MAHTVSDEGLGGKRSAASQAVDRVASGMVIGLGSGSTARLAVSEIGRRLAVGALQDVIGVPTSRVTEEHALASGVPLTTLDRHPDLDLTIDGADEVDLHGNLLKGLGGALLWEKIVASCSRRLVIAVDSGKLVDRLGERHPVPVEVVAFGWTTHLDAIGALGGQPALRMADGGAPYRTDEGHLVLDVWFREGITDLESLAQALRERAGVVETGLFLGFDPEVVVGDGGQAI
ncbi:MAG: ribose 5-phosphate isomerase A [Gemmatimonadaceae bacterium]